MTTDVRALAMIAVLGVAPANATSEQTLRVHASKALRDATGLGLMDIVPEVNWAIEQVKNSRLDRHKAPNTFGGWRYEFPNGYDASVINDPHRPFRFELLSEALNVGGDVVVGLTSEQVEAKLHVIAALPNR